MKKQNVLSMATGESLDPAKQAQSINNIYLSRAEVVLIINALNTAPLPTAVIATKNDLVKKLLNKGKVRR